MAHKVFLKAKNSKNFNYAKFVNYKDKHGKTQKLINADEQEVDGWEVTRPIVTLDIEIESQKRLYEWLKGHPHVRKGRFTLEDTRAKEQASAAGAIATAEAVALSAGLTEKEYKGLASLLGINTKDLTEDVIRAKVIQSASLNPERFMSIFNDKDKEYRIFLKDARAKGLITFVNGTWKYNTETLGLTEDSAIIWLKDNTDVYALLKQELRGTSKKKAKK
jgi:hypothetical protein